MAATTSRDLWVINEDADVSWNFCQALLRDDKAGLVNSREFELAECALRDSAAVLDSDDIPIPEGFPVPALAMPKGSCPDFFYYDGYAFASRPLKEAIAQPEDVVQFVPVKLVRGGPEARARDYHLMRVLAQQPAMDLARSECRIVEFTNRLTEERSRRPENISRIVLREDIEPRTEIFRMEESPTYILVSDALAERVLRAGCIGVEFADPSNRQGGMGVERYRTLTGVAERRVGFLD